jgi:hypothetical protein
VRQGDLGRRGLSGRRIGVEQIDPAGLRVAESVALRPTRDARGLREEGAVQRTISRRMTPGDFVRELGADNKTTIPAPWTRGYGPPPAGVDGARYGTPRRTDRTGDEKPSRGWVTNPGTGSTSAPTGGVAGGSGRRSPSGGGSGSAVSPRQAPRPAPWYTPRATGDGASRYRERPDTDRPVYNPRSGSEGSAGDRTGRSGGEGSRSYVPRSSGGGQSSGSSRPRSSGGSEGSGSYAPRSSGGGPSSGGYQPRSGGGGQSSGGGSSSGGARARSSGGGSGGSSRGGGGHSAARPRGSRE